MGTGDTASLGDRSLRFLHTPYLHWPDTQCTYLEEERILFSGDVFGCHFCDERLFNDEAGDFRFSFEYYYAHIMRPFREHVHRCAGADRTAAYQASSRRRMARSCATSRCATCSATANWRPRLHNEVDADEKTLMVFYISAYGSTTRWRRPCAKAPRRWPGVRRFAVRHGRWRGADPFIDLVEEADGIVFGSPTINGDAVKPVVGLAVIVRHGQRARQAGGRFRLLRLDRARRCA